MKKALIFILCVFLCILCTACLSWPQRAAVAKKGFQKYREYKTQKAIVEEDTKEEK